MPTYPELKNEQQRLSALRAYDILDTPAENEFDELTKLASEICQTPVALITLLDGSRQWFKSAVGTEVRETPKEHAFCAHTIAKPEAMMIVEDLRTDQRFQTNPLVTGDPNVVFYAGVSLISEGGFPLGTLCVLDVKPKELNAQQILCLEVLAKQVMTQIELKKKIADLKRTNESLVEVNSFVQNFASTAAHDIKNPLTNMQLSSQMLEKHLSSRGDEKGLKIVSMNLAATTSLIGIVDEMLSYSKDPASLLLNIESIDFHELVRKTCMLIKTPDNVEIDLSETNCIVLSSKVALEQILINLLSNAIRYSDKKNCMINISAKETITHYLFKVKDNGMGINDVHKELIFQKHVTIAEKDRFNERGNGLGLATVKGLIEKLKGTIKVESEPGYGSSFIFSIKKRPFEA